MRVMGDTATAINSTLTAVLSYHRHARRAQRSIIALAVARGMLRSTPSSIHFQRSTSTYTHTFFRQVLCSTFSLVCVRSRVQLI